MARTVGQTEPQRPSAVTDATSGRRLRGDLDNIVLMALRKEPERRYPSVEQFSDDIRRHLEARPVLARRDTLAYRAGKFVRRNTAASVAAALVVLSLVGGIVMTTWQAERAREQEAIAIAEKARAERRFNEVRQLARSVLFDYHDAIENLSGATAIRERLVKDGLAYLDSLAGEASDDPELQRELAAAYDRVGDVRGRGVLAPRVSATFAGATDSYIKALRIREALASASPGDMQNRRDLAASYHKIGAQLVETSEAVRGMEYIRKGTRGPGAARRRLSGQPGNPAGAGRRIQYARPGAGGHRRSGRGAGKPPQGAGTPRSAGGGRPGQPEVPARPRDHRHQSWASPVPGWRFPGRPREQPEGARDLRSAGGRGSQQCRLPPVAGQHLPE